MSLEHDLLATSEAIYQRQAKALEKEMEARAALWRKKAEELFRAGMDWEEAQREVFRLTEEEAQQWDSKQEHLRRERQVRDENIRSFAQGRI